MTPEDCQHQEPISSEERERAIEFLTRWRQERKALPPFVGPSADGGVDHAEPDILVRDIVGQYVHTATIREPDEVMEA